MKQVRCVETGAVYNSITDAAKAHGVTPGMIAHVLQGRQATAAGFTWAYTGSKGVSKPRYRGIYRDRADNVYKSLRAFAVTHGYTIRQVQAAFDRSTGLVDLDMRVVLPMVSNKMTIRYVNGEYFIHNSFDHPRLEEAKQRARETGEIITLIRIPGYENE